MQKSRTLLFILATLLVVTCLSGLVSADNDDCSGKGECPRSSSIRRKPGRDEEDYEYPEPEEPTRPPKQPKKKHNKKITKHPDATVTSHEITVEDYRDDIPTIEGTYTRQTTYIPHGHQGKRPRKAVQRHRKGHKGGDYNEWKGKICIGRGDFEGLNGTCHHKVDCYVKDGTDIGWCYFGFKTCCLFPETTSTPIHGPAPGPATSSGPAPGSGPGPGPATKPRPGPAQPSASPAPSVQPGTSATAAPTTSPPSQSIRPSKGPLTPNPSTPPSGVPGQPRPTNSANLDLPTYGKRNRGTDKIAQEEGTPRPTGQPSIEDADADADDDEDDDYFERWVRPRSNKRHRRRTTTKRPRRIIRRRRRTTTTEVPLDEV